MVISRLFLLFPVLIFILPGCMHYTGQKVDNKERDSNWEFLFDGRNADAWRGFKMDSMPGGWVVRNDELVTLGHGGDLGGDIITREQFEDFELSLEWSIAPTGNSGIFFHVLEGDYPTVYATGPEYQLIDDVGFPEKLEDWQMTGANYGLHVAKDKLLKPVGEWNTSKIRVVNGNVTHWLNGQEIVSYELWTPEWKDWVQHSKWIDYPYYGLAIKGHIGLQDHGTEAAFRNILIRDLTDIGIPLFNGKNLEGWEIYGTEEWYVDDGELICESGPDKAYGYLATDKNYKDFMLRLEFMQESNGNSGVFFRSQLEGTKITGWQVEVAPKGNDSGGIYESYGRGWLLQIPEDRENILKEGKWNQLVIRVKGDRVITWLNNEMMADLTDEKIGRANGSIALQIHDGGGVKVRWRNIYLKAY
jgi:hypothetical protein